VGGDPNKGRAESLLVIVGLSADFACKYSGSSDSSSHVPVCMFFILIYRLYAQQVNSTRIFSTHLVHPSS